MMVDSSDNHEIVSTPIIFNWKLLFHGGSTAVVGQMEGRLRVLVSINKFGSIMTLYLPINDFMQSPGLFGG